MGRTAKGAACWCGPADGSARLAAHLHCKGLGVIKRAPFGKCMIRHLSSASGTGASNKRVFLSYQLPVLVPAFPHPHSPASPVHPRAVRTAVPCPSCRTPACQSLASLAGGAGHIQDQLLGLDSEFQTLEDTQEQTRAMPQGNPQPHSLCLQSICKALFWCFLMQNKMKKKSVSKLEWLQEKEIKMIKGLEGLTYKERLKELIMYSSDKG